LRQPARPASLGEAGEAGQPLAEMSLGLKPLADKILNLKFLCQYQPKEDRAQRPGATGPITL